MPQNLQEFIDENAFCSEYLFKDWESFLDILYAGGGRGSSILWWDRCKMEDQRSSVGSGGYKDPDDPEFMYAETHLSKEGLEERTLGEIKEYIDEKRRAGFQFGSKYFSHELVPSFYLCE